MKLLLKSTSHVTYSTRHTAHGIRVQTVLPGLGRGSGVYRKLLSKRIRIFRLPRSLFVGIKDFKSRRNCALCTVNLARALAL